MDWQAGLNKLVSKLRSWMRIILKVLSVRSEIIYIQYFINAEIDGLKLIVFNAPVSYFGSQIGSAIVFAFILGPFKVTYKLGSNLIHYF